MVYCLYPLVFGYLLGTVDQTLLDVLCNIADFINKIAFVLKTFTVPAMHVDIQSMTQISPRGYFFGYLAGTVEQTLMDVLYNIADFINKIAFVLKTFTVPAMYVNIHLGYSSATWLAHWTRP